MAFHYAISGTDLRNCSSRVQTGHNRGLFGLQIGPLRLQNEPYWAPNWPFFQIQRCFMCSQPQKPAEELKNSWKINFWTINLHINTISKWFLMVNMHKITHTSPHNLNYPSEGVYDVIMKRDLFKLVSYIFVSYIIRELADIHCISIFSPNLPDQPVQIT